MYWHCIFLASNGKDSRYFPTDTSFSRNSVPIHLLTKPNKLQQFVIRWVQDVAFVICSEKKVSFCPNHRKDVDDEEFNTVVELQVCLLCVCVCVCVCVRSTGQPFVPPPTPATTDTKEGYTKKDCLANNGMDYTGDLSVTMRGFKCLSWKSPAAVTLSAGKEFLPEVGLVGNHCRNPDGDLEGPWCFVDKQNITMDYCELELCGELKMV